MKVLLKIWKIALILCLGVLTIVIWKLVTETPTYNITDDRVDIVVRKPSTN